MHSGDSERGITNTNEKALVLEWTLCMLSETEEGGVSKKYCTKLHLEIIKEMKNTARQKVILSQQYYLESYLEWYKRCANRKRKLEEYF